MQPSSSIDHALVTSLEKNTAGTILVPKQKKHKKHRPGVMLFEPFLGEYDANFGDQIKRGKLAASRSKTKTMSIHSDLPFAMVDRPMPAEDKVLRVLVDQSEELQDIPMLKRIYRSLMISLHELHEEVLRDLMVPRSARIELHRDLFRWLEKQLYGPDVGIPVFGFVSANNFSGIKIGATQSALIKLFSGDPWSEPLHEGVKFLIETY
ncbi:hypothetical protein PtA15_12A93 [Puccinia triticina]|uniref:Uncharacterized protein n=1 Tax=Puccinia triticina TaxID=208348 RepID=A0ABY7CYX6_9BASI|nr:uncharacterized protein PtA15_12A93 [Puccinia triticina]WAQ90108.1 hypothetical protein PtA15_12A93 [Puccinia triticina]WAR61395.1 hypothetical protein PtB15_12B80 [Puccinia triticina]